MEHLVAGELAQNTMTALGTDAGRNAFLGDWQAMPTTPGSKVAALHFATNQAVQRVKALPKDRSRPSAVEKNYAAMQISEDLIARFRKTRAELKHWASAELQAGNEEIASTLRGDADMGSQLARSEIRAFIRSKVESGDDRFDLRGMVEKDPRFIAAIIEAPSELSGLSPAWATQMVAAAAAIHAPEAFQRVQAATAVARLADGTMAEMERAVPLAFFNRQLAGQMDSRVDTGPLGEG